ncbi:MAG: hypothetical protein CL609_14905 [Anaerolineaceae bacterium]|nr:hypothetical protein [Anaerolineaceae bacterium]
MENLYLPQINFQELYTQFSMPIGEVDCGTYCAPHNPSGKPFCCDIEQAIPAAYLQEWAYLQKASKQWQLYKPQSKSDQQAITEDTPEHMVSIKCNGPQFCHRPTRALSCRQFPFFPYITADDRFIGLTYEWVFEPSCWLISHLEVVTESYRTAFIRTYDHIFDRWMDDYESYAIHSEEMRLHFQQTKRRIPILHRNGNNYLLSPGSDRLAKVPNFQNRKFGFYI